MEFVDYLRTPQCQRVMEENNISIHVNSGNSLVEETDVSESMYDFLQLQMDETKNLIKTVLRYSGSLKGFTDVYLYFEIGNEEEWELDVKVFVFSKFIVANHNNEYLVMSGIEPIYCRHSRATKDDVMIETMNENNWLEFLDNAIERPLSLDKNIENDWIDNIFQNLHICYKTYELMFRDIAVAYFNVLFSGSRENIVKVFKFIDVPLRNVRHFTKIMGAEKLFCRCVINILKLVRRLLSIHRSPDHLIGLALPSFSKLCDRFRSTRANWMLSAFFLAQLFRDITDSNDLTSEALVTNMLEE